MSLRAIVLTAATCLVACGAARANAPPLQPTSDRQPLRPAAQPRVPDAKRARMIETLQRQLRGTQDPGERARILRRLAQAYLDQAAACTRARLEIEERLTDAAPDAREELAEQAEAAGRCTGPMRLKAVETLTGLIEDHPDDPRADEHLFSLASTYWDLGDTQAGRKIWTRLIKDFPQSRYTPHAFLAFGEWYFSQADLDRAMAFYQKVLQFPDSDVATYARYKQGWCYYNLGAFDKALEVFVTVAKLDDAEPDRQIAKEARKDAVMAFAQVGGPDQAEAFFSRLAPGQELPLLSRLASLWHDAGRYAEAIAIDRLLVRRLACDPAQLMAQSRLLQARMALGDHQQTAAEAERLVQLVIAQGSCADATDTAAQRAQARWLITRLADSWQREQQATRDAALTPLIARLRAALESLDQVR